MTVLPTGPERPSAQSPPGTAHVGLTGQLPLRSLVCTQLTSVWTSLVDHHAGSLYYVFVEQKKRRCHCCEVLQMAALRLFKAALWCLVSQVNQLDHYQTRLTHLAQLATIGTPSRLAAIFSPSLPTNPLPVEPRRAGTGEKAPLLSLRLISD